MLHHTCQSVEALPRVAIMSYEPTKHRGSANSTKCLLHAGKVCDFIPHQSTFWLATKPAVPFIGPSTISTSAPLLSLEMILTGVLSSIFFADRCCCASPSRPGTPPCWALCEILRKVASSG